jgi:hypothetical protein
LVLSWDMVDNSIPHCKPTSGRFFVIVQIEEAIFSWRGSIRDFFCCYFHHPCHTRTVQLPLAVVALKREPAARGKRAPRAPSIVGWFCRPPSQAYATSSVAPPICHFALVAARVPHAVIGEDVQSGNRLATTPDGPEAVRPVGKSPRCDVPEPLFRDGPSDSEGVS